MGLGLPDLGVNDLARDKKGPPLLTRMAPKRIAVRMAPAEGSAPKLHGSRDGFDYAPHREGDEMRRWGEGSANDGPL